MEPSLSPAQVAAAKTLRIEAMHLQEIEGNPLRPDEVAMFEMFEREAWPHERRLSFILRKAEARAAAE